VQYNDIDVSKIKVLNNYMLVRFIQDGIEKEGPIKIVKLNNSTKLRSQSVGEVINCPDSILSESKGITISLKDLQKEGTVVAYNPMSVQMEIKEDGEVYQIIRSEDVICILDGFEEEV